MSLRFAIIKHVKTALGANFAAGETSLRNCSGIVTLTSAFDGGLRVTSESEGATFDDGTFYITYF